MTRSGPSVLSRCSPRGAVALGLSACLVAGRAHAQDPTRVADDLFNAGSAAYQRGEFSAAARAFDEAERRAPRAETSYNAGIAWEAAGDARQAANALRVALDTGQLPERLASDAQARLTRLSAPFAELRVLAPAGTTVEIPGLLRETAPIFSYVDPGTYRLEVQYATGEHETRSVQVDQGQPAEVRFSGPAPAPPPPPRVAPVVPTPPRQAHTSWQTVVGITALGTAGVAAGTGLALGVRGLAARDRFDESGHLDANARNQALSLRTEANLAFAGALVFSALGVVLLVEAPRETRASAYLRVGPSSLELGRQF